MFGARWPWVDMSFWGIVSGPDSTWFSGNLAVNVFMALFREDQQYLGFISLLSWNIKVESWKLKVESWNIKV